MRLGPREDGVVEGGERVDEDGGVDGRAVLEALEARGERRVGGEGEREGSDHVGVSGEERREQVGIGGRGDDGEADPARGEQGSQVEERHRVALRGEGHNEDARLGRHLHRWIGGTHTHVETSLIGTAVALGGVSYWELD